jgi:hypothetical protein
VISPDIAQRTGATPAKPPGNTRSAPLFGEWHLTAVFKWSLQARGAGPMFGRQNHPMSPHDLARRFLEFRRLRKQVQDLEQCATQNSQTGELRGTATKRGAENDNREPCRSSEPALKASLGKRLACVDRHHSETIDYRPACFRSGLAAA